MSKQYYRLKKHRELQKKHLILQEKRDDNIVSIVDEVDNSEQCEIKSDVSIDQSESSFEASVGILVNSNPPLNSENDDKIIADNNQVDGEKSVSESSDNDIVGLENKLKHWCLNNLETLCLNVVTDLLLVLRSEGYTNLPKTAQTLLGTNHRRILQQMRSGKNTVGEFIYLGIKNGLQKVITDEYSDNEIAVFVHIDGMSLFKNSPMQVWPTSIKVFHKNYIAKPFAVSIFCGDSKPYSIDEYLENFLDEANQLIKDGVTINGRQYAFKILGIIADSPARAFLKCCKYPGGFYACERCTIKGISQETNINRKKGNMKTSKRVYPQMDCELRTKKSFEDKLQLQHHRGGNEVKSPLLSLSNFDPVRSVILDPMHLLYDGVMKSLIEKWISRGKATRLRITDSKRLNDRLVLLTPDIPCEFQRKKFTLEYIAQWKATQYRFFLHYCGPIVLKNILSDSLYKHFMLLFVACRILNSEEFFVIARDYARELLRKFFDLLSSLYGKDSQVLNMHNLIHAADDVEQFGLTLSDISAFWGESFIGTFKNLVKSRNKPLTQIANRLEELESSDRLKIKKNYDVRACKINHEETNISTDQGEKLMKVDSVKIKGATFKINHPDNIAQLNDGTIFQIKKIFAKCDLEGKKNFQLSDLYLLGCEAQELDNVFCYPTASSDLGIVAVRHFSNCENFISANRIKQKCVFFRDQHQCYVFPLQHM